MYTFQNNFGFLPPQAIVVGTAVANVGIEAHHAAKVAKLQDKFTARLESDEEKKAYINYVVARLESVAVRLAKGGVYRPGTAEFDKVLGQVVKQDMNYKGLCNADIYWPKTTQDKEGAPRKIWASISRTGFVAPGADVPPDVGPVWATGCKNAHDQASMAWIARYKGERKHRHFKIFKEDIGSMDLFLRAGTGIFMIAMLLLVTRVQKAVIKEQAPPPRKKIKIKKPKSQQEDL